MMLNRSKRTIEKYKLAGAETRLFKALCARLAVDVGGVLSNSDMDKLIRAIDRIHEVCSRAEDSMFRDHPEVSNEYLDVFYGDMGFEPRNEVDREVIEIARNIANEFFKRKNH